jgi:hypothetical protein
MYNMAHIYIFLTHGSIKGFLAERDQLFSGVVACVSQLEPEDNNAMWAMLTFYGGEMRTRLDPTCTHLIVAKPSGVSHFKVCLVSKRILPPVQVYN